MAHDPPFPTLLFFLHHQILVCIMVSTTPFLSGISYFLISFLSTVSASSLESMPLFRSSPCLCFSSPTVFFSALNASPSTIDTGSCSALQWILALFYLHLQTILLKVRWISDSLFLFPADSSLKTTDGQDWVSLVVHFPCVPQLPETDSVASVFSVEDITWQRR